MMRFCVLLAITCSSLSACKEQEPSNVADDLRNALGIIPLVDVYLGIVRINEPTEYSVFVDIGEDEPKRIDRRKFEEDITVAISLDPENESAKIAVQSGGFTIMKRLKEIPISNIGATTYSPHPGNLSGKHVFLKVENQDTKTVLRVYATQKKEQP